MELERETDLATLAGRVERCELALEDWHHAQHIAVTCWTLWHKPLDEAVPHLRRTIQAFNAHHGIELTQTSGYHETLTRAWAILIDAHLNEARAEGTGLVEATRAAIGRFADKRLLLEHYTRETLMTWEARLEWVEPDLRPLA